MLLLRTDSQRKQKQQQQVKQRSIGNQPLLGVKRLYVLYLHVVFVISTLEFHRTLSMI